MTLGRAPRKSVVPDVRGLPLEAARAQLGAAGFADVGEILVDAGVADDEVVQQVPVAGSFLPIDAPVRLQVSRASWIHHLPAIYHAPAPDGSHPVQGLLWIAQSLFSRIERRLDRVWEHFDPLATPADFLPWLASWLALGLDAGWDDRTRRHVLRQASRLYRVRGSREALIEWIRLFTGLSVTIDENAWTYAGLRMGAGCRIGVDSMILERVNTAHAFVVRLPVTPEQLSEDELARLYRVINAEKPAHTIYCLAFAERPADELDGGILRVGVDRINP
jgi:phage tail-like protein